MPRSRAGSDVDSSPAYYAAGEVKETMQSWKRWLFAAGVTLAGFLVLTVAAPTWLATTTSAGAGHVVMPQPTPDPHP